MCVKCKFEQLLPEGRKKHDKIRERRTYESKTSQRYTWCSDTVIVKVDVAIELAVSSIGRTNFLILAHVVEDAKFPFSRDKENQKPCGTPCFFRAAKGVGNKCKEGMNPAFTDIKAVLTQLSPAFISMINHTSV